MKQLGKKKRRGNRIADRLVDGRTFRTLTVVNQFSRECVVLEANYSLSGWKAAACLERIGRERGYPQSITADNVLTAEYAQRERNHYAEALLSAENSSPAW